MADSTTQPQTQPSTPPLFVAGGYSGLRVVSWDGRIWKNPATGRNGQVYRGIAFGNGVCLASGSYGGRGIHAVTSDGITWHTTETPEEKDAGSIRGVVFGNGEFTAFGGEAGAGGIHAKLVALKSKDGRTWSDFLQPSGIRLIRRIAYGNGIFVGVGDTGRCCASPDCVAWTDAPHPKAKNTLIDIAYGKPAGDDKGLFVGVGLHSLRMTSLDGVTWSEPLVGQEGEHLNSICWTGDQFVAAGPAVTYFSPDGKQWKREANHNGPLTMTAARHCFVGAHWKGRILFSSDAVHWEQVEELSQHIETLGAWPSGEIR